MQKTLGAGMVEVYLAHGLYEYIQSSATVY